SVGFSHRAVRRALPDPVLSESAARPRGAGRPGGMMASVVMADDGIAFDGGSAATGPLGGAETAFAALAEALAARGHRVLARHSIEIIPYGVLDVFRHAEARQPPPPRAIFTSNPERGLDWLLGLWAERIAPAVPGAELHIYAGPAVYGGEREGRMTAALGRAD